MTFFFTSEALPIPTATSLECWDPNSDGFVPGKTIDPATKQRFFSTNLWYLHFPAIKTSVQVISSNDGWNIWKNHLKPSQTEVFQSKNIFFSGSRSDLCHLPPRLSPAKAVNFGRQVANPSRHTHADELQCWRKLLSDGRIDDDGYLYTTQRLSFSPNAGN